MYGSDFHAWKQTLLGLDTCAMQAGMRWAEQEEGGLSKHRAKPVTFAQFYPEANGVTSTPFSKICCVGVQVLLRSDCRQVYIQRSAKRRGCLPSYSQAEPIRELTQSSPRLLAEPCKSRNTSQFRQEALTVSVCLNLRTTDIIFMTKKVKTPKRNFFGIKTI